MAAAWEELAETHNNKGKNVVVAEVDCTVDTGLCSEHGVRGYPTIKYFVKGVAEDYVGGRGIDALTKFLQDKAASAKVEAGQEIAQENGVYVATDATFEKIVDVPTALVKFYAPW